MARKAREARPLQRSDDATDASDGPLARLGKSVRTPVLAADPMVNEEKAVGVVASLDLSEARIVRPPKCGLPVRLEIVAFVNVGARGGRRPAQGSHRLVDESATRAGRGEIRRGHAGVGRQLLTRNDGERESIEHVGIHRSVSGGCQRIWRGAGEAFVEMQADVPETARREPGVDERRLILRLEERSGQPSGTVSAPKGASLAAVSHPPEVGRRSARAMAENHRGRRVATKKVCVPVASERRRDDHQSVLAVIVIAIGIDEVDERGPRVARLVLVQALKNHVDPQSVVGSRAGLLAPMRVEKVGPVKIDEARQQLDEKRSAETTGKRHLDSLRGEYASAMGKRSSLEAVITEHGYTTESVRKLFTSGAMKEGLAPVGVLADFLEVEDRYEHVVDDFLRDELNYIVVKSWDAADEGLRLLRSDVDGRATFLVHPEDSQAKFSFLFDESAHQVAHADSVVPLKHCIRVLNGFGKSLEVILPKLGNGYIVPDADAGRDLALNNPDAFFLSKSGECFHNVTVTGGKQRSQGPLAMKRELREVLQQMGEMERAMAAEEMRVAALGREIFELTGLLHRLEDDKREGERQAMTSGHTLRQLEMEMVRVRERLSTYERELGRVAEERNQQQMLLAEQSGELSAREEQQRQLELEMQAAHSSLEGLRLRRDEAAQLASETRAQLATLEERRRGAVTTVERIEALVSEVSTQLAKLKSQLESAAAEKQQREAENVRLAEQVVGWTAERELANTRDRELQAGLQTVRVRIVELEEALKAAREALDAARDRRGELSAAQARVQSDVQHMSETCVQELSQQPHELMADDSLPRVAAEALASEEEAYREMRTRLDNMGPVNMMALEEYKEIAQRHEFLETQRLDLLQAIENTQNTIKEIDTISRQKFEEAFKIINENFSRTFSKLFGGGQGFMRLTDIENSAESGIDVVASPPGKKLQNVLLLSGGEKALTALALLVGIFQYQPSPFCILDEVDAPLDEANIGRFTELIREMSSQTQFIIITHSKRTMGMAPVLYGVTMQEPGVSKLVSVRFHEEPARLTMASA